MDADRFDALTRALTIAGSRRRALALALSGALAPLLGREETEAHNLLRKCRKKSGKQKKKCIKKAKAHNAEHANCNGADLENDEQNCGECGKVCASGERCVQRQCAPADPDTEPPPPPPVECPNQTHDQCGKGCEGCGGTCMALCPRLWERDQTTCGCCISTSPPPSGEKTPQCSEDAECCNGRSCCELTVSGKQCVDLNSNETCGTRCGNVQDCNSHNPPRQCVNGECVPCKTDQDCSNFGQGLECVNNQCVCIVQGCFYNE